MSGPASPDHLHCLNCGETVTGNFCGKCGQEIKEIRQPFFYLLKDAVRTVFELDGRAYRTLYYLFTRPGFLTREYVSGRRATYTPPLRLFLVISIVFFLIVSAFTSLQAMQATLANQNPITEPDAAAVPVPIPAPAPAPATEQAIQFDGGLDEILELINNFSIPFLSDARNENLRRYMRVQAESNLNDLQADPSGYFTESLDYITIFILLMMPILALIQKLLYLRSRRYYIEHLILTLHNHSFLLLAIFLAATAGLIEDTGIAGLSTVMNLAGTALSIWIMLYLFMSLRNFFEQGYVITTIKYLAMAIIYSIVTAIGIFYFAAMLFFLF